MDEAQYLALVRHGKSFANVETEKPANGLFYAVSGSDRDMGITPQLGEADCFRAGGILLRLFPRENPIARIWISQFRRIKDSASIISQCLGYGSDIRIDARLNKRSYGKFWNLTYEGLRVLHPEEHKRFMELGHLKYRPPEGENYYDLFERVDDFKLSALDRYCGNQLVVGHSVVLLALQRHLTGLPEQEVVRQYETAALPNGYVQLYRRCAGRPWQRVFVSDFLFGDRLRRNPRVSMSQTRLNR